MDLRDLYEVQYEIERDMITRGVDRYRHTQGSLRDKGREASTVPGRRLMAEAVNTLSTAISQWIVQATSGGAGRRHTAVKYLQGEDAEVIAYLTCRTLIDSLCSPGVPVQAAARAISKAIQDERRWRHFEETNPAYCRAVKKGLQDRTRDQDHIHTVLIQAMNKRGVEDLERWSMDVEVKVGMVLLDLFMEHTGLVEASMDLTAIGARKGRRSGMYVLRATQQTLDWIKGMDEYAEALYPCHTPCVVPPRDWTTPTDGGYHGPMADQLTLVKTHNRGYLQALEGVDMPVVYDAINALQRTPWQINKAVLRVMRDAIRMNLDIGDLPTGQLRDLPPKPAGFAEDEEITRQWKREARDTYDSNRRTGTKVLQLTRMVSLAERYEPFERIYYPYSVDFRGRAYPVAGHLHPQGSDPAKGLLRFGEGKPLGEDGAAWLAIHLANNYGFDKATLQERIDWVVENEEHILQSATTPLDYLWWSQGDNPWQILAACYEWAGFRLMGEEYVSHLPVAMDGSCNGLQHYSAMLRDEVGGAAVNLTPAETPSDIYREVLEKTVTALTGLAAEEGEDTEMAQALLASGQVNRKLVKRPVMTMPYGSKQYGILTQIRDELDGRAQAGPIGIEDTHAAATLLARLVWQAIGDTVVAAREGMDWLQKAASLASAENLPISWTAPSGFPVLQEYHSLKERRINTQMAGSMLKLVSKDPEHPVGLDKPKQRNGIAPNFVHSLDASAMMLTVVEGAEEGITCWSMVHDSYATHACDAGTLAATLREVFVSMYEDQDVLGGFAEEILEQLSPEARGKLPALPSKGSLELTGVLESDFFFA